MSGPGAPARVDVGGRLLLGLAAVAVAFAAADTYVVVLALPDMMAASGLSAEDLQRAAPIMSGFMLGYIAVLPLIGRIADLRGRLPVLIGSLVLFSIGSLVTAAAYDLPTIVTGRVLQGIGGGGLLPATLALVADLYPAHRRNMPLGIVNGVQEFGNVVGPLYGAVILAFGTWRTIFWVNLAVGLLLAVVIRRTAAERPAEGQLWRRQPDWWGLFLALSALGTLTLVLLSPAGLLDDVTLGLAFLPVTGESRWLSPLGIATGVLAVLLLVRCLTADRPILDVRGWWALRSQVDLLGTALLSAALAGVILAFATADPQVQVLAPGGPWLLLGSVLSAAGFWWRNRQVANPLVPVGALARTPAWGALLVSFFVGAAVIAAVVDVPLFARITIYNDSQLGAALVLVRFLVGLPVGALLGGWLTHYLPAGLVAAAGMAFSAVGFGWMSQWGFYALEGVVSSVPLFLAGLGIGLAMPPTNASLLASTASTVHGVTSALLVVARTVGKLVGISALTTIGLRAFYAEQDSLPAPMDVCGEGDSRCREYSMILQEAGLTQLQTIFLGAAVSCVIAGLLALVLFRNADTRAIRTSALEGV